MSNTDINVNKIDTDTSEESMDNTDNVDNVDNMGDTHTITTHSIPSLNSVCHTKTPNYTKETPLSKMMKSVNNREEEQIISKLKLQMEQKEITKVYAVHTMVNYKKLLGSHERTFEKLDAFMNELDPKSDIRNGTYKDKLLYKQYAMYALIGYIIACVIRYYILKLIGYD